MKKSVLTGVVFAAFGVAPAMAADLTAPPVYRAPRAVAVAVYNWTGL